MSFGREASPGSGRLVSRTLLLLSLAAVVAHGAVTFRLLSPLGFVQDDYLNFAQVAEHDSAWRVVHRLDFGRYAPTHRLAHLGLSRLQDGGPISWDLARGVLAAIAAIGAAALALCVLLLTRRLPLALFVWLATATSSATFSFLRWWASALHVGVHWAAVLVGWLCVLLFIDSGRRSWLVLGFLLWALALGAYEKALVATALCLAASLWRAWQLPSRRRGVLALAGAVLILDAGYLIHLFNVGFGSMGPTPWVHLMPALLRAVTGPFSRAASGVDLVGSMVIAMLVVSTVVLSTRRMRTLKLWTFSVFAAFGLFLPVAIKRLSEFGASAGEESRYLFEWWPLWLVSFALALTHLTRRAGGALLGAAGLLWLASIPAQWSEVLRWTTWGEAAAARAWTDTLRVSMQKLDTSSPVVLFEGEAPPQLVEPWYYPYSRASIVLPLLVSAPLRSVDLDIESDAYVLTGEGALQRASWLMKSTGPAGELEQTGGSCGVETVGESLCVSSGSRSCHSRWRVPQAPPDAALFALRTRGPSDACIEVTPGEGSQAGVDGSPRCNRRGTSPWTWFRQREYLLPGEITVSLPPSTRLCLDRWAWGRTS
ncbi:MAG: hypothetical protein ACYC8T_07690 [Myxococcaceae bacterium]